MNARGTKKLPGSQDELFGGGDEAGRPDAGDAAGHRGRLRARLLAGDEDALADHEVIEYLLTTAIPRKDVKPLAHALVKRFGSLAGVLGTDPKTLALHPGMGETSAAALRIVGVAAKRMARAAVREQPVLSSWQALIDYLHMDMAHLNIERVRELYSNMHNMLIADEIQTEGTIDESVVHPREIIRRAMDLGTGGVILVHNQPSGSPEPSRADIQITNLIADAGSRVGGVVHDPVIIGKQGHVGLKAYGLI